MNGVTVMEEKLKRLYEELYDAKKEIEENEKEEYTVFTAMKGKGYSRDNDIRFMLVGRAVYGWDEYRTDDTKESFVETSWVNLNNLEGAMVLGGEDRFEWIDTSNNVPKNIYRKGIDKTIIKGDYKIRKSAFWSYTKEIWDGISGESTEWEKRWFEKIVWTNLYKIAPHDGGNPSEKAVEKQKDICVKLLKAEIEYFQPTHVLFVTGADWFEDFLKNQKQEFDNLVYGEQRNCCRGEHKNEIYVEGTANYVVDNDLKSKVVVVCRPESRTKNKYTDAVIKHFD